MATETKTYISFRLRPSMVENLDRLAYKNRLTRSDIIRVALALGMNNPRFEAECQKMGELR